MKKIDMVKFNKGLKVFYKICGIMAAVNAVIAIGCLVALAMM